MSAERTTYVHFLALAYDWAVEAGMPKELVLRRLCEWAMAGAFPEGAFIKATGTQVAPFDIYMSFRSIEQGVGSLGLGGVVLGGWEIFKPGWSIDFLSEVLLSTQDVLAFCERTNTLAPPMLLRGFIRFWAQRDQSKHLAPPLCPDAEEHALKWRARDSAIASMNSLRSRLSELQGKAGNRLGIRREIGRPIDLEFWAARWEKMAICAQNDVAVCKDAKLLQDLDTLKAEWTAFVAENTRTSTAPTEDADECRETDRNSPEPDEIVQNQLVRRGRPLGSGSYEPLDAPLVEEMHQLMNEEPCLSPTAAANRVADRAAGGGTVESKARRLAERYSQKFGRR